MGGTQHTNGNNNTRAYCVLQLALGNMGPAVAEPTSSAATTTCRAQRTSACSRHSLPGYYGLKKGSWKHWARVWDVEYDYLAGRFANLRS